MEHFTVTQELLKWFGAACLVMMGAFLIYGWLKGLSYEADLRPRKR